MFQKDPVYPLTMAVERVKDIIPDQDAEGWLRDAIAADRITWAYVWMEDEYHSYLSLIDIPPMAAIMDVPHLKIDWSKGTAAVLRPYEGLVECRVVVSRGDLDRELADKEQQQDIMNGDSRYEVWEAEQRKLIKTGEAKGLREAAEKIAEKEGLDTVTVERETRRVRKKREKREKAGD